MPLAALPGGKTRRVRKPSVFIRFAVHAAKAGMNIRGCAPLSTPGGRLRRASSGASPAAELPLWSILRKFPQSVDTERGNGGRPQAVSSSPCPGEELPLWSKLRKFLPSVDTERRNGYNTYRVRPKRSAIYEQVFSPIRGITALRTAGRLFLSDSDSYGLNVALKRSKQHHNQFYHTSHLLSDGVLTADCPWYYTCEYYNAYVEICLYYKKIPPFG